MNIFPSTIIDLPNFQNPNRKFQVIKKVGEGSEGQVYLAKPINWQNHSQDVALKVSSNIRDREIEFIDQLISFQQQWDLQEQYKSQIVKIYERTQYNDQMIIIMEVGEMDLHKYCQNNYGQLSLSQKIQIMQQMARSIRYLHSKQLMHRDIKPENFLKVGLEFKLIDFGLIKKHQEIPNSVYVGSQLFFAPEIAQGASNYNQGIDIWSLGCTYKELLKDSDLQKFQQSNDFIIKPQPNSPAIDQKIKGLISSMLKQDPKQRITIDVVLKNLNEIQTQLSYPFKQFKAPQTDFQVQFNKQAPQNPFPQENNQVLQTTFMPIQQQQKMFTFISQGQSEKSQPQQIDINTIKEQNEAILKQLNTITQNLQQNTNDIKQLAEQQKNSLLLTNQKDNNQELQSLENKIGQKIEQQFQQFLEQVTSQLKQHKNQEPELIQQMSKKFDEEIQKQTQNITSSIAKLDDIAKQDCSSNKQFLIEQINDLKEELVNSLVSKQSEILQSHYQQICQFDSQVLLPQIDQQLTRIIQSQEETNIQIMNELKNLDKTMNELQNNQCHGNNNLLQSQIQQHNELGDSQVLQSVEMFKGIFKPNSTQRSND